MIRKLLFLILVLVLIMLPVSGADWYNISSEGTPCAAGNICPGTPYRYTPSGEGFSSIRNGNGTSRYYHPIYLLNLTAGSTSNNFVELSRPILFISVGSLSTGDIIEDAYVEFTADTYTNIGDFDIVLTTGDTDNINYIDSNDYEKYNNLVISDTITVSGNGTWSYSFHLNLDGIDYLNAMRVSDYSGLRAPVFLRFVWDVNNNFDGIWSDNGLVFMNLTQIGNSIYNRAYFNMTVSVSSLPLRAGFFCDNVDGVSPSTMTVTSIGPITVQCYDNSIYTAPTSYNWSSNGQVRTVWDPTFTYTEPGVYSINLTVCNGLGCDILVKPTYVTVVLLYAIDTISVISMANDSFLDVSSNGLVRNASNAIYTVYNDDQGGGYLLCYLAWSTDNGLTWDKTSFDCQGYPVIAIDAEDKISIAYTLFDYSSVYYRNYTVSEGFGEPYQISDPAEFPVWISEDIDSYGNVHMVYDDMFATINYRNVSSSHELGDIINIAPSSFVVVPFVRIGADDNVHILWSDWNTNEIIYRNITDDGVGDQIVIGYEPLGPNVVNFKIDMNNNFHIIYYNGNGFYYAVTSASQNFQIADPLMIGGNDIYSPAMSLDSYGTAHFVWGTNNGIFYSNLSGGSLTTPTQLSNYGMVANAMYNIRPANNIREMGIEFIGMANSMFSENSVFYGYYPRIPTLTPTPIPTSPFNTVTIESTAQTIQMVIMLGILLSVLAIIAMLILKFIAPSE